MTRLGCHRGPPAAPRRPAPSCGRSSPSRPRAPRELLAAGMPLAGSLPGRPAFAVAGFVAGGRAALDALEGAGWDVLGRRAAPVRGARSHRNASARAGRDAAMTTATSQDAYRACEADRPGARRPTSSTGSACCRRTSAARCAPRTRSRAASTTSATAPARRRQARRAGPRARRASPTCARASSTAHTDNTLIALADARERFDLPLDAFDQLVDGVELDVRGTTYETFDELAPLLHLRRRVDRAPVRGDLRLDRPRARDGSRRASWESRCS